MGYIANKTTKEDLSDYINSWVTNSTDFQKQVKPLLTTKQVESLANYLLDWYVIYVPFIGEPEEFPDCSIISECPKDMGPFG